MKATLGLWALIALLPANLSATTWDEPWMDAVISNAESFVRVKVLNSRSKEVRANVTKHLAGTKTPSEIRVAGYSLLRLVSSSVPVSKFPFEPNSEYYLFLKKADKSGRYSIATPTTGWAKVTDKGVSATYRHSYHRVLVPEDVYETTMVAIFNAIHEIKGDETQAHRFVTSELSKPPVPVKDDSDEIRTQLFLQHAALETFRYLGSNKDLYGHKTRLDC